MSDDLADLAAALDVSGPNAEKASYKALRVEAQKMRDDWRAAVSGARNLGGLVPALSYDVRVSGLRALTAEVGYTDAGQGELGNIAEFGTSTQGPKRPAGAKVLRDGADRLERYLGSLDPL